jgi:hypothetical protein
MLDTVIAALGQAEDDEDDDPGGETDFRGLPGATVDDEPEHDKSIQDDGELDNSDDEPSLLTDGDRELDTGDYESTLGWANDGLQLRLNATPDDLEGDGDADAEPSFGADAREGDPCDQGEPSGDEGDYSNHAFEPVDLGIRMTLRDSIIRKRSRRTGDAT